MQFTGAELITRLIERQGVTVVAGVPGGMCLPLYDALAQSRIRHVLARHEQAAGFIAQGMARHLAAAGFDPLWVAKGEAGLARLRFERPDVCVLDLMLPGIDGWKLIETAREEGIGTPIVVVSARGTEHDLCFDTL